MGVDKAEITRETHSSTTSMLTGLDTVELVRNLKTNSNSRSRTKKLKRSDVGQAIDYIKNHSNK